MAAKNIKILEEIMKCRICNAPLKDNFLSISEKMFGTSEAFNYLECNECKCLQIADFPENMSKYYPKDYYSLTRIHSKSLKRNLKLKAYRVLSLLKKDFYHKPEFTSFGLTYSDRKKKILDIGSGNGKLLVKLREHGFKHLTGIDPFIIEEINIHGLNVSRKNIDEETGEYDIIMSHHSLEHMPDPHLFFNSIPGILASSGRLILRIPVYPNYIWQKYGTNWIQLDAPRHFYTFSLNTIRQLCNMYFLKIIDIRFDSQPWSLASTEYCLNGRSHIEFTKNIKITKDHILACNKANEDQNGDSVCLVIVKK